MSKSTDNELRNFFAQLPAGERDLVVAALDLQLPARKPLTAAEKQDKLQAMILRHLPKPESP